jgi:hypothetical protein
MSAAVIASSSPADDLKDIAEVAAEAVPVPQ